MNKKTINRSRRALLFFAGAAPDYASRITPSDLIKLTLIGATPLVPTIIAYVACGFAISSYYDGPPLLIWGFIAPLCALFIFFIEILLNATLSPGASSRRKWITATPRLLFSIILSLTLAIPMKLALFSGPVKRQLKRQLEKELYKIEQAVGPVLQQDSISYAQALATFNEMKEECTILRTRYIKEIDGSAPSGQLGIGELSLVKKDLLHSCEQTQHAQNLTVIASEQRYTASRAAQQAKNQLRIQEHRTEFKADLFTKLEAWHAAAEEKSILRFAGILIVLLFTAIDIIPTIIKIGTHIPSYALVERLDHKKKQAKLEALTNAYTTIAHEQSKALVDAAIKKREVHTYRNLLWASLRKLDVAYQVKQKLETQSVIQSADPVDLSSIEQTVHDIDEFNRISHPLQSDIQQEPANPPQPSHSSFVLKRIV